MNPIKMTINGQLTEQRRGTTIYQAAKQMDIPIPILCFSEQCTTASGCMVCAVLELTSKKFLPACSTVIQTGMEIETQSEEVCAFRRTTLELLLSEHRGSCEAPCFFVCPQALDIPRFLRQLVQTDSCKDFFFDKKICEDCGGKCERACRRSQLDENIKIRDMLFQKATHQVRESVTPRTSTYTHLMGKLKKTELDQILKTLETDPKSSNLQQEAARCLQCACRAKDHCDLRDLATQYHAKQHTYKAQQVSEYQVITAEKMIFHPSLCIKCGRCVQLAEKLKPGHGPVLAFRAQQLILSPPFGKQYQDAFCGFEQELAHECPTGALELVSE